MIKRKRKSANVHFSKLILPKLKPMRKITKPIRVKRRGKKLIVEMTRREKSELRERIRNRRKAVQRRQAERLRNDGLIVLLTHFIDSHYANPTTGKYGAIITGPVGARLSAASSLRALLIENEPVN